jgi:hypothetical protein
LAATLALAAVLIREGQWLGKAPFRYPQAATDVLARQPLRGRMFNAVRYGGYLIWRLYPRHRVFVDGRLAVRTRAFFRDYLQVLDEPERFFPLARQHDITVALLPTVVPNQRYLPLARALYLSPEWQLAHLDGHSALFRKTPTSAAGLDLSDRATVQRITQEACMRVAPRAREHAIIHVAVALMAFDHPRQAATLLTPLARPEARSYLARCHYLMDDYAAAKREARDLIRLGYMRLDNQVLLAQISHRCGQDQDALNLLHEVLQDDPAHPGARLLLERMAQVIGSGKGRPQRHKRKSVGEQVR